MAVRNEIVTWALSAGEDLQDLTSGSGDIFKPIDADGTVSNDGLNALGILQSSAPENGHVTIAVSGITKFVAGAAVTAGDQLTVTTSGYMTTAGSGDHICGKALIGVTSGAVGTGVFAFGKSSYYESSSAHIATYEEIGFTTTNDLSAAADANKIVDISAGDYCVDGNTSDGVMLTGASSGGTAYIRTSGLIPVRAGGVLTAGQSITSAASGWAVAADSGDVILGRAAQASAAGNSGSTFTAMMNFATPHYATSCLDVQY